MPLEIRWLASYSVSCLHAAWALGRGPLADPRLAETLADPLAGLRQEIAASGVCEEAFWRHLIPLSAGIENNRQLADLVLRKTIGQAKCSEGLTHRLAGWIAEIEAAVRGVVPDMVDRLADSAQWLRSQWASVGSALLAAVARRTDANLIVPAADAIVVWPASGGSGAAHLLYNSVRIEALASDPIHELPEVVRLAWLLAQLNLELPIFSEAISPRHLPSVAACSLVPPVLAAAAELDLVSSPTDSLGLALERWKLAPSHAELLPSVSDWWEICLDTQPPWHVALAALDRMLFAAPQREPVPV